MINGQKLFEKNSTKLVEQNNALTTNIAQLLFKFV